MTDYEEQLANITWYS